MSKKDIDAVAMVITLGIAGAIVNLYKEAVAFYEQSPVLFILFTIGAALCGIFFFAAISIWREQKWYAIEKIEDMHRLHWREFEEFIEFVLKQKGFKTRL